jgi:hypothetical protein
MRPSILLKISYFLPRLFERNLPVTTHESLPSLSYLKGQEIKQRGTSETKKEYLLVYP